MGEWPIDYEGGVIALGLLADIGFNTARMVELLEDDDGEEPEED